MEIISYEKFKELNKLTPEQLLEQVEDDPAGIELAMDMGEKITEEQYNEYVKFIESRWCKCI